MLSITGVDLLALISPWVAVLIATAGLYLAWRSAQSEREAVEKAHRKELQVQASRLSNAADRMYGKEADNETGTLGVPSLIKEVEEIKTMQKELKDSLGVDGHTPPRPVLQILGKFEQDYERLEHKVTEQSELLDDMRRQQQIKRTLRRRDDPPGATIVEIDP